MLKFICLNKRLRRPPPGWLPPPAVLLLCRRAGRRRGTPPQEPPTTATPPQVLATVPPAALMQATMGCPREFEGLLQRCGAARAGLGAGGGACLSLPAWRLSVMAAGVEIRVYVLHPAVLIQATSD